MLPPISNSHRAVLNGLSNVLRPDIGTSVQVSHGTRYPYDPVIAAGSEPHAFKSQLHQFLSFLVQGTVGAHFRWAHPGVAHSPGLTEALVLNLSGSIYPLFDGAGGLPLGPGA